MGLLVIFLALFLFYSIPTIIKYFIYEAKISKLENEKDECIDRINEIKNQQKQ